MPHQIIIFVARQVIERLDETDLDIDEAIIEDIPSMIAMNQAAGNLNRPRATRHPIPPNKAGKGVPMLNGRKGQPGPQPAYPETSPRS